MLFAINILLLADMKWRYYCVEKLVLLPSHFRENIQKVLLLHVFTVEEIERCKRIFMEMWQPMVTLVEQAVQMPYEEFKKLV